MRYGEKREEFERFVPSIITVHRIASRCWSIASIKVRESELPRLRLGPFFRTLSGVLRSQPWGSQDTIIQMALFEKRPLLESTGKKMSQDCFEVLEHCKH